MVRLQWTRARSKAHSADNADPVGSRRMMTRIAPILLLAVASGVSAQSGVSGQSVQKPKADLIFTHRNIYTREVGATSSLAAGKRAEALAGPCARILAVGAREEIRKLKGPEP